MRRASKYGLPLSRVSSRPSSSAFASTRSASFQSSRDRLCGFIRRQRLSRNAARAAFTARSTSSARASATSAITSSVAGFTVAKLPPLSASTHSFPIQSRVRISSFICASDTRRQLPEKSGLRFST